MKNITIPGVLPGVIALMLVLAALRCHYSAVKLNSKGLRRSKYVCIAGAVIYFLIAVFQLLETAGISFRGL